MRVWLASVSCFVALLSGPVQLLPSLLALGAMIDQSHLVQVALGEGEFVLTLRHEPIRSGENSGQPCRDDVQTSHHHGLAARCVCALNASNAGEPDHLARFTSGVTSEESRCLTAPKARACGMSAHPQSSLSPEYATQCAVPARLPSREAHSPPVAWCALQPACCVALLI